MSRQRNPPIFCVVCSRIRPRLNSRTKEAWQEHAFLFEADRPGYDCRVCLACSRSLKSAKLIHDSREGENLRAAYLPGSIVVHDRRIKGLVALDPLPQGLALPYPGKLIPVDALKELENDLGIKISREFAAEGPKADGASTVILGQFVESRPLLCAQFINCKFKTKLQSNAKWGKMIVDKEFLKLYPELTAKIGDAYPCLRTTRAIAPGEEIILDSYGAQYWQNKEREKTQGVYGFKGLSPQMKRKLEELEEATSTPRSNRARKKQRKE